MIAMHWPVPSRFGREVVELGELDRGELGIAGGAAASRETTRGLGPANAEMRLGLRAIVETEDADDDSLKLRQGS